LHCRYAASNLELAFSSEIDSQIERDLEELFQCRMQNWIILFPKVFRWKQTFGEWNRPNQAHLLDELLFVTFWGVALHWSRLCWSLFKKEYESKNIFSILSTVCNQFWRLFPVHVGVLSRTKRLSWTSRNWDWFGTNTSIWRSYFWGAKNDHSEDSSRSVDNIRMRRRIWLYNESLHYFAKIF
jgi:hypothetical protein